ncbi:MAG: hypothetical protein WKF95_14140 [Rubrobacter sp.]
MPKLLRAREPQDVEEERKIHKVAGSRHAPGDWITRARIISLSWQGLRTTEIAEEARPDVVVLDLAMPVMGGEEATGLILRGSRRPRGS